MRKLSDKKTWTTHEMARFLLDHEDATLHVIGTADDGTVAGHHVIQVVHHPEISSTMLTGVNPRLLAKNTGSPTPPPSASMTADDVGLVVTALRPFAVWLHWTMATREHDGEAEELPGHTIVLQTMGAGGSMRVYLADVRLAAATLKYLHERYPDAPCWSSEGGLLPDPELHPGADRPPAEEDRGAGDPAPDHP